MNEPIILEGTVENIVYENTLNGYSVFELSVLDDGFAMIVCTGVLPGVNVGETLKVRGAFANHPTYGRQFNVAEAEKAMPTTEAAIEKYLGSGLIKGVREKTARKIVGRFGKDTFTVIADYPEKLAEINGITMEKAYTICAAFHEQAQKRKIFLYLQSLSISTAQSLKIYDKYKENTIEVVQANPYALAGDVFGIGFKLADSIAFRAGIAPDSPNRVEAGLKYMLNQAVGNGHVFLPKEILLNQASELLELPEELIETSLAKLQMERVIWQEKQENITVVYLNSFFYAENNVAKALATLSLQVVAKGGAIDADIARLEKKTGVTLAERQQEAVREAMNHGVLVVTGGPGTGKTTTINTIIHVLKDRGMAIELAAPTGRAAKRMTEATGMPAKTIHRLLEISFVDENSHVQTFGKNRDNPIEADVVIIDEMSMVDILLMNSLLSAVAPGTRLILVGDVDQLPSVGAGNVLKDIIASDCLPVIRLTEVFRQAQESAIVMNAHRINRGEQPVLNDKQSDFFFTKRLTAEGAAEAIVQLVSNRLPAYMKCSPIADIQVLCPMRKSPLGVENLNQVLQARLNPPQKGKNERPFRSVVFREGDKVMQIKNNYNLTWRAYNRLGRVIDEGQGVFNGDTGLVKSISHADEIISVAFDDHKVVEYEAAHLDELDLAYAITIHKSQGSEYGVVVMPILTGPPMLMTRNLLYTGVTRAKRLAVIVGSPDTLFYMIGNKRETYRYSALQKRLVKMFDMFLE